MGQIIAHKQTYPLFRISLWFIHTFIFLLLVCFVSFFFLFIIEHVLLFSRLVSDVWSSCLSFLHVWITDMCLPFQLPQFSFLLWVRVLLYTQWALNLQCSKLVLNSRLLYLGPPIAGITSVCHRAQHSIKRDTYISSSFSLKANVSFLHKIQCYS